MKITVYELLGLMKDGKAPYKFIIDDSEYRWDYVDHKYYRKAGFDEHEQKYYELFEDDYNLYFCLNDEVEIIEEKPYLGLMTNNVVANTAEQEVKFELCLMFGNECKFYKIDTYNKTINELRKENK